MFIDPRTAYEQRALPGPSLSRLCGAALVPDGAGCGTDHSLPGIYMRVMSRRCVLEHVGREQPEPGAGFDPLRN